MQASTLYAHIEGALLELFWWHVGRSEDRFELLQAFAEQSVARTSAWDRGAVRLESTEGDASAPAGCFCCRTEDRKLYWHHVVQIQHGGSNHPRNRVAICYRCHARIHPWLPSDRKGERRGGAEWSSLGEILEDATQLAADERDREDSA